MFNYRVSFFKLEKEKDDKGKTTVTDQQYLGSVVVDDLETGIDFTVAAKAFRHANSTCLLADKIVVERL